LESTEMEIIRFIAQSILKWLISINLKQC
jgi:hypothetical protein